MNKIKKCFICFSLIFSIFFSLNINCFAVSDGYSYLDFSNTVVDTVGGDGSIYSVSKSLSNNNYTVNFVINSNSKDLWFDLHLRKFNGNDFLYFGDTQYFRLEIKCSSFDNFDITYANVSLDVTNSLNEQIRLTSSFFEKNLTSGTFYYYFDVKDIKTLNYIIIGGLHTSSESYNANYNLTVDYVRYQLLNNDDDFNLNIINFIEKIDLNLKSIDISLKTLVFGYAPILVACLIVYLFIRWFYRTFFR